MTRPGRWLTTEEAAARVGMTSEWVRRQIAAGRLPATVWRTGSRPTYRLRAADWEAFVARYAGADGEGPGRGPGGSAPAPDGRRP